MSEVNWEIITGNGHFFELDEIQGDGDACPTCGQPRQRKEKRKFKAKLFTEFAKSIADTSRVGKPKLTTNQLRNFYDVIKATQNRIVQQPTHLKREDAYRIEKRRLNLLFSKVHYARANKIPEVFAKFMEECLKIVTKEKVENEDREADYEDFEAFVLTFEAVAGYFGKD